MNKKILSLTALFFSFWNVFSIASNENKSEQFLRLYESSSYVFEYKKNMRYRSYDYTKVRSLAKKSLDKLSYQVIEELKVKIGELEFKIDDLIEKNKQCAIKLARLEERMTLSAKKNAGRKKSKIENGNKK